MSRSLRHLALPLTAVLLLACGDSVTDASMPESLSGGGDRANQLTITPAADVIVWDNASFGGPGVVATLRNTASRDYYANLGDAFNSALDQETLHIATGGGAGIERQSGSSWNAVSTGILVEGSRVVRIRAGGVYEIRGFLTEPRVTGTMRIRVRYFASADTTGTALLDYSTPFTVR